MTEAEVTSHIRLAASKLEMLLWRNNSGVMTNPDGRPVRFGLGNDSARSNKAFKSSDYIGLLPVTITPRHVGRVMAVFTALEMKEENWQFRGTAHEKAQQKFLNTVLDHGGIAGFCTSEDDLRRILKAFEHDGILPDR